MLVGILAIHGSVSEHESMLYRLGVRSVLVKTPEDLNGIRGLIIPGGESTTVGKFLSGTLGNAIKKLAMKGTPIYGTCTGMIVLGNVASREPHTLGLMDVTVKRNAFGRQVDSFEEDLAIPALGKKPFHCVYIRAPVISRAGANVDILARSGGNIVFAKQGNLLASSFHPELTNDTRMHEYFLKMCK